MLILRDVQVDALEEHLFGAMQQRVERAIAATFPELSAAVRAAGGDPAGDGPGSVRAVVARGIENAVEFEIGDGPDFAAFIALGLALRLGPPGPSADWIYGYLRRPDVSGPIKLRMIESRLRRLAEDEPALAAIARRVAQAREGAAE